MPSLSQLFRSLGRRRGSTILLVILSALGVALSTTMFAVFDTVLLNPLPYRDADRLVKPWNVAESFGIDRYPVSWDDYIDFRDGVEAFDDLAATRTATLTLEGADHPASVGGARVTANLFDVLGLDPVIGRAFTAERGVEEKVAVISHGLWSRLFASSPDVTGRTIRLDGEPYTIIGVLPRHNRYPRADTDVFIPLLIDQPPETDRAFHFLNLVGRLRDGSTLEEADAQMKTVALRIKESFPDASGELSARVIPLKEEIVGTTRRSLGTLFSAVQVLFFIAWVNIAMLLLARGIARKSELQVRAALGATRWRLLSLLLSEAVVITGLGCALGLAASSLALNLLPLIDPVLLPRAEEIRFSPTLVLWALGLGLGGALLFGGLPAWAATRDGVANLAGTRATDRRTSLLHTRLVAAQVTLALPLIVAASMQLRSVRALASVDVGFPVDRAIAATATLPGNQFGVEEQKRYIDRATETLGALPGVTSVAAVSHLPLSRRQAAIITYRPDQEGQSGLPNAHYRIISPGFLATLGVPLITGREFEPHDDEGERFPVIIDETLAGVLYPDRDAVGHKVRLGTNKTEWEVIGVARAARLLALDEGPPYTVYVPIKKNLFPAGMSQPSFVMRSDRRASELMPEARGALQEVDASQAVTDVRPLAGQVDDWMRTRRTVAWLLWTMAAAALLLASSGIYATLAVAVDRRRREMAIRSALGATPRQVVRRVVMDGLKPGVAGTLAGLAICLVAGPYVVSTLYGVGSIDVPSLAGALLIMLGASLAACAAPARRASRENPARLLKEDEA